MDHAHHHGGHAGHDMGTPATDHAHMASMEKMDDTHSMHSMDMHGMGMHMSFYFGVDATVLFDFWKTSTVEGLVGSMIGIFILAALYEGLKYYREYLFWKSYNSLQYRSVDMPVDKAPGGEANRVVHVVGEVIHKQPNVTEKDAKLESVPTCSYRVKETGCSKMEHSAKCINESRCKCKRPSMLSLNHLFQTVLHVVQITLSYFLMLIFMTYNVWLCLAVILGAAAGYFLFGWKKSVIVDVTEHCH